VLGYPVGGSVTLAFHSSMLALLGHEISKGDGRLLEKIQHTQGLYVADNRTLLIQRFMDTTAEWLLQIDTDIEFPRTLVETLVEMAGEDKKILAASVPLGSAFPTCAFMRTEVPGIWTALDRVDGVVECDGIATAVCLVHRQVFEDIADQEGQSWMHHIYLPLSNELGRTRDFQYRSQGEDLAFCVRAAKAGHKVYCGYVPGLKHHKTMALSHDDGARVPYGDPGVGELVEEVG
jgi:hypothetical protein